MGSILIFQFNFSIGGILKKIFFYFIFQKRAPEPSENYDILKNCMPIFTIKGDPYLKKSSFFCSLVVIKFI